MKYRIALSRFRLSSHNLAIELGRHARPIIPVEQRLCKHCDSMAIEDEVHFLLKCPRFKNERNGLLECVNMYFPGIATLSMNDQFQVIMSCCEPRLLMQLGRYLYSSTELTKMESEQ